MMSFNLTGGIRFYAVMSNSRQSPVLLIQPRFQTSAFSPNIHTPVLHDFFDANILTPKYELQHVHADEEGENPVPAIVVANPYSPKATKKNYFCNSLAP